MLQLLAIVGLSCALGFTFNAASPVGVHFGATSASPGAVKAEEETLTMPALPAYKNSNALPSPPTAPGKLASLATNVSLHPAPVHWPEAKALVAAGRAVLVDVRPKALFDAGHIPGATSLPENSPPQDFTTFLSQQPTNLMVIAYCSSTSCSLSARVADRLVNEFHWPVVRYMTGGYLEYQQAELTKPATPPSP